MKLLQDKVAIITGAGRGLGRAYARLFAAEGARVVVNDVGRADDGSTTAGIVAGDITADGGTAAADTSDVGTADGGRALLDTALERFGGVDILVNNAGILRDRTLAKLDEADWDAVLQVNLKSMYNVTRPVFSWMKDNGRGGVIVNTSSTSALIGNFGQTNYAASKGGVWAFSNVLALEGARCRIRVWTLAPAATSALTEALFDDELRRELDPEHVAPVVLYMVSDLSGTRTGRCVFASGQRIMELKMQCAPGIPGAARSAAALDAHAVAEAADRIFMPEPDLTLADLSRLPEPA